MFHQTFPQERSFLLKIKVHNLPRSKNFRNSQKISTDNVCVSAPFSMSVHRMVSPYPNNGCGRTPYQGWPTTNSMMVTHDNYEIASQFHIFHVVASLIHLTQVVTKSNVYN